MASRYRNTDGTATVGQAGGGQAGDQSGLKRAQAARGRGGAGDGRGGHVDGPYLGDGQLRAEGLGSEVDGHDVAGGHQDRPADQQGKLFRLPDDAGDTGTGPPDDGPRPCGAAVA